MASNTKEKCTNQNHTIQPSICDAEKQQIMLGVRLGLGGVGVVEIGPCVMIIQVNVLPSYSMCPPCRRCTSSPACTRGRKWNYYRNSKLSTYGANESREFTTQRKTTEIDQALYTAHALEVTLQTSGRRTSESEERHEREGHVHMPPLSSEGTPKATTYILGGRVTSGAIPAGSPRQQTRSSLGRVVEHCEIKDTPPYSGVGRGWRGRGVTLGLRNFCKPKQSGGKKKGESSTRLISPSFLVKETTVIIITATTKKSAVSRHCVMCPAFCSHPIWWSFSCEYK